MSNHKIEKIIHQISYYPEKRLEIFKNLRGGWRREVILSLSKHVQYDIISRLNNNEIINLLEHLDNDEAADILQLLSERKRNTIVEKLNTQKRADISLLLKFDPETAAGLMNVDYVQVEAMDNIFSISKQVKIHEKRTGKLPTILIMENGKLIGYLPGHNLGLGKLTEKATKYIKRIKTIPCDADTDQVIELFRRYPHNKVVVLGKEKNVLGIIYSDDILKTLHEKESASLYNFAGVHDEESVFDPAKTKIKFRYKWLLVNLGTTFLAASTVGLFDETIAKYVLLAVYMPIVAGMGGNAATQTLAVMVRGISLKQIEFKDMWRALKNELGSGLFNGLLNGVLVATIVFIKDHNIRIALILGAAMVVNLLNAAFFGTFVPLFMKKIGKDPASSASIFITTATDVLGFLVFLGLASILLK